MATGKPPWSQQYQEVAALFHVGTTKSHPPIPQHLSSEAKDFLLKCLQEEPDLRPTASELLQHPFVAGEYQDPHTVNSSSNMLSTSMIETSKSQLRSNSMNTASTSKEGLRNTNYHSEAFSTMFPEKLVRSRSMWESSFSSDMCRFDDEKDDFPVVGSSFNPMSEPLDECPRKFEMCQEEQINLDNFGDSISSSTNCAGKEENNFFTFPCDAVCEHDDEVTETKIRAFLDEKALDLKKLQTPLYEEFFSTSNVPPTSPGLRNICKENLVNSTKPPLKSKRSPTKVLGGISAAAHADNIMSPGSYGKRISCDEIKNSRVLKEIQSPRHNEWGELLQEAREEPYNSPNYFERQRMWKEELDQELEIIRQAAVIGAPKSRRRDCLRFISPGK